MHLVKHFFFVPIIQLILRHWNKCVIPSILITLILLAAAAPATPETVRSFHFGNQGQNSQD